MKEVVIDASVIASWFLPDESHEGYKNLFEDLDKFKILVPTIFIYEFMNILLSALRQKRITGKQLEEVIRLSGELPLVVEPVSSRLSENDDILICADRHNLSVFDASYLMLSVRNGRIPLATYDKKLLAAAKVERIATKV